MSTQYTPDEVKAIYAETHPGSDVVCVEHDDAARFCEGEPWFVFVGSEDATPERIILPARD